MITKQLAVVLLETIREWFLRLEFWKCVVLFILGTTSSAGFVILTRITKQLVVVLQETIREWFLRLEFCKCVVLFILGTAGTRSTLGISYP